MIYDKYLLFQGETERPTPFLGPFSLPMGRDPFYSTTPTAGVMRLAVGSHGQHHREVTCSSPLADGSSHVAQESFIGYACQGIDFSRPQPLPAITEIPECVCQKGLWGLPFLWPL